MQNNNSVLHNWSAGLLCSVGLYLAQKHFNPLCLVNLRGALGSKKIIEQIPPDIFRSISDSLSLPLFTPYTNSEEVENDLNALLSVIREKYGVNSVILNAFEEDNMTAQIRKNYENCQLIAKNLIKDYSPQDLFYEAMSLGFKAYILSVNEKSLNRSYLGTQLTLDMLGTFKEKNVHPFGSNGEFETLCTAGPNFKQHIALNFGDVHFKHGLWYREVSLG